MSLRFVGIEIDMTLFHIDQGDYCIYFYKKKKKKKKNLNRSMGSNVSLSIICTMLFTRRRLPQVVDHSVYEMHGKRLATVRMN